MEKVIKWSEYMADGDYFIKVWVLGYKKTFRTFPKKKKSKKRIKLYYSIVKSFCGKTNRLT